MKQSLAPAVLLSALVTLGVGQTAQPYPDVFYYKFNEGAGNQIINHAIPGGSLYVPNFQFNGLGRFRPGQLGQAYDFAGLDRLISNGPSDLSRSFTIEAWMKTNYTGTTLGRLWGDYSSSGQLFRCYIGFYNTGSNHLGGGLAGTGYPMQTSTFTVTDQAWHHVAIVHDTVAQTLTTYVDGQVDMVATSVLPGGIGANFILGGVLTAGSPFNGQVDEFRWWSTARTQAEIQATMNVELVGNPLQTHFRANRRSGGTPLLVQFTDASISTDPGGITSWAWDFDGDGLIDSNQQNPCYVYQGPGPGPNGTYTVSLTVTDASNPAGVTLTLPNYIRAEATGFVVATCGSGDLYLGAPTPPSGWVDGFTLVSLDTAGPVNRGWFFGLYPDFSTWNGLSFPAAPGNPFHFVNVGAPNLFPQAVFSLPPGSLAALAGISLDAVVVYRDAVGFPISATNVSRVTF